MREATADEARWLNRFTAGAIVLMDGAQSLEDMLRLARDKESVDERARKDKLIADAVGRIDKIKEDLRKFNDVQQTIKNESGKSETLDMRDKQGKSQNAFDIHGETRQVQKTKVSGQEVGKVESGDNFKRMMQLNGIVSKEAGVLSRVKTQRSYIDEGKQQILKRDEPLFTDDEIADEIFTPLVRDKVMGETAVPKQYSAVQKMLDGSNDLYITECKEKGKELSTGAAQLTKDAIKLGATVATTIVGGLAPVTSGQHGVATSGVLDKETAQRATDITNGIAAGLTSLVDIADNAKEWYDSGDFPVSGFKDAANLMGGGIAKIVAGATGNVSLGVLVGDSISAGVVGTAFVATVVKWKKDPSAEPPWQELIGLVGDGLATGLNIASDKSSGEQATKFANAATAMSGVFKTIASAQKNDLIESIRTGKWENVFKVLEDASIATAGMLPNMLILNPKFNEQDSAYGDYQKTLKAQADLAEQVEKGGDGAQKALEQLRKMAALNPPKMPGEKLDEALRSKLDEKIKEKKAKEIEDEKKSIEDVLKKEQEDYQKSLVCLGSDSPDEAEFKSIAKLIEKIERDRAIWDGLTAMFGAGIGAAQGVTTAITAIAAEVAPPLKAAGQLMKYIINLKAASDRLEGWLKWREARKDSDSALSAYGTSIQNFVSNQGSQFAHYSIQAAANAIQALLAAGEMSPYAPAFKIAGGSVAAAAAAEDMIYKFYKQTQLRKAWKQTKIALEPGNRENRKMGLLVREINPTLAKYALAYGAVIAQDPIAITAMNRVGLDRETLARAGDKAADVKKYLVKLYPDDKEVIGILDVSVGGAKVPTPELATKAWALSCLMWTEKENMATPSPPLIAANLKFVETELARKRDDFEDEEFEALINALGTLRTAFRAFTPVNKTGQPMDKVRAVALQYADIADAKYQAIDLEWDAKG
jgi:hypothetical protein